VTSSWSFILQHRTEIRDTIRPDISYKYLLQWLDVKAFVFLRLTIYPTDACN